MTLPQEVVLNAQSLHHEMLRAARNQALYREVNEKIEELNRVFAEAVSLQGTWVCECADPDCTEMMELTLAEYEAVRAHPDRFAVMRGHEHPLVERVVDAHDQWVTVEKFGAAARFAIEHDPRAHPDSRNEPLPQDAQAA